MTAPLLQNSYHHKYPDGRAVSNMRQLPFSIRIREVCCHCWRYPSRMRKWRRPTCAEISTWARASLIDSAIANNNQWPDAKRRNDQAAAGESS